MNEMMLITDDVFATDSDEFDRFAHFFFVVDDEERHVEEQRPEAIHGFVEFTRRRQLVTNLIDIINRKVAKLNNRI